MVREGSAAVKVVEARRTAGADEVVHRVLSLARGHLGMEIAFYSRILVDTQVLEAVEGDLDRFHLELGVASPLADTYCGRVIDGRLPPVISDARHHPVTAALRVTAEQGIGSYVGAPVRGRHGDVYGMLCCLSREAEPHLCERDGHSLALLAELLSDTLLVHDPEFDLRTLIGGRIRKLLRDGGPRLVYQPVVELGTSRVAGVEALSRFPPRGAFTVGITDVPRAGEVATVPMGGSGDMRGPGILRDLSESGGPGGPGGRWPDEVHRILAIADPNPEMWFAQAALVGLDLELELAAIRGALADLDRLPDSMDLSLNASSRLVSSGRLAEELTPQVLADAAGRLILEITEHDWPREPEATLAELDRFRAAGVRLAVDDAGSGYAGLTHILRLRPDLIKLDHALTAGVDADPARLALADALVRFGHETGADLVAEGVSGSAEVAVLREIGVRYAQGFYLARPGPLPPPETIAVS